MRCFYQQHQLETDTLTMSPMHRPLNNDLVGAPVLQVVLYNRGKTANKQLPGESDAEYARRVEDVKTIVGDRKDPEVHTHACVPVHDLSYFSNALSWGRALGHPVNACAFLVYITLHII